MEKRGKGERGSLLDPKIDCLCLQFCRFCEDNGNSCLQFDLLFYLRRSMRERGVMHQGDLEVRKGL